MIFFVIIWCFLNIVIPCQAYYADKNPLFYFSAQEQLLINASINKFMEYDNAMMWKPISLISNQAPFIFFHQRKAGGTSVRTALNVTASKMNVSGHISCYDVSCNDYHIPTNKVSTIYAGHFQWNEHTSINHASKGSISKFSCMTNLREPVSRIISCLYFRFGYLFKGTCLSKLSNSTFLSFLDRKLDRNGNSCLNEPFRVMSGADDEKFISSLGFVSNLQNHTNPFIPRLNSASAMYLESTLKNIQTCVPHILELHRDNEILFEHKFPLLAKHDTFKETKVVPGGSVKRDGCGPPTAYQQHVIEKIAAYESVLYNAVLAKVKSALIQLNDRPKQNVIET